VGDGPDTLLSAIDKLIGSETFQPDESYSHWINGVVLIAAVAPSGGGGGLGRSNKR